MVADILLSHLTVQKLFTALSHVRNIDVTEKNILIASFDDKISCNMHEKKKEGSRLSRTFKYIILLKQKSLKF